MARASDGVELETGFLLSGGDSADLIKKRDWSGSPLGAPACWPNLLKSTLATLLSAPQPMFLLWGQELTFYFNDAYAPLLGSLRDDAMGGALPRLWPELWPRFEPAIAKALAGEGSRFDALPLTIERHGHPENTWWSLTYVPVRDEHGAVQGLVCITVDMTAQVLGEQRAEATLERQRLLLQQMPGFVAILSGPDHVYEYVNDAYVEIAGDRAFVGRPVREVFPDVAGQGVYDRLDRVFETGQPFQAQALPILLAGEPAERYIDLLYEPIRDNGGSIVGIFIGGYDVTERVRAEAALRASETFTNLLLNSTSEAFYAVDTGGVTTLCNDAFLTLLGFDDRRSVIGRKLHDVIHHSHPDGSHYAAADCPLYRAASSGQPAFVSDELFFRTDGVGFPVEYRAEPIVLNGVLQGAICTFTDITERKAAEQRLAASEAQFRTFAQAMPNHVWAAPPDGMLDWFNERVYAYSGAGPGELDGQRWTAIVHPDDLPGAAARWAASLASGQAYETEFRLRRADGAYRWHLARALPIVGPSGEITRWIGTNTDIEDRKSAEQALAALNASLEHQVAERTADLDRAWRNAQDLIVILDRSGLFRAVNPAADKILGLRPEEMIGRSVLEFVHPDDRAATAAALASGIDDVAGFENRYRHRDGSYRWLAWVASPQDDLLYATGRHITAEKEAAAALAIVQDALRQSQKMEAVGQLTGGIAHDFNNMLAVVVGSLDLLRRRLPGDDARSLRHLDAASEATRRAALLTERLLAFSRQQPLRPEPVDANALVAGMSDLLRHSLGADIRLETVLAGGLWRIHADPNQLENVILNLAVNGRDAMIGGGRMTIETQNAHLDDRYAAAHPGVPAGQYVLIAVTDSGNGMPPEIIARAFDPFFTTKAVGKGTGLGLSQVYGFVKQSGGHVKIYSEPGQGTTVKVYLPRLLGAAREALAAAEGCAVPHADAGELVLVVEDEPAVRAFSLEALTELGYRVLEADGAPAAMALLAERDDIDLLFTDVVMPDVNGRKLVDQALALKPGLKVLFTTGYTRNAVVHNGVLDPGVQLIGKPFTVDALGRKVRAVLDG